MGGALAGQGGIVRRRAVEDKNLAMARQVAEKVRAAGGETYFVGGFVRDRLMGRPCKDVDIEVHGITPQALRTLLNGLGECTAMGASFGVLGLKHYQLDIAMPRRETATGRGHRDFDIDVDPFIGTRQAAIRRDFTINALMENVLTGEIVDHFGGQADLRDGVLRRVNDRSFGEDPLRVLRAAQFAARFGFRVEPETAALCAGMDLSALARERVAEELKKALLKAERPSVFFECLAGMNQLRDWFPEVAALRGVPQDPFWHPEGDVWNHTMQTLDAAAGLRPQAQEPLVFLLAALCHDLGKPACTEVIDGRVRSLRHEVLGTAVARQLLERLTGETKLIRKVENLVLLHMRPNQLAADQAGDKAWMKLLDQALCPEDLLLLAEADRLGQLRTGEACAPLRQRGAEMLALYRRRMAAPAVTGGDLQAAGFAPGPEMGKALAYAHRLQLAGVCREHALSQVIAWMRTET